MSPQDSKILRDAPEYRVHCILRSILWPSGRLRPCPCAALTHPPVKRTKDSAFTWMLRYRLAHWYSFFLPALERESDSPVINGHPNVALQTRAVEAFRLGRVLRTRDKHAEEEVSCE